MRGNAIRFGIACAIASALGVGVALAASHTVHIDSKVTITQTSPVFAGKVKGDCQADRTVKLHVIEMDNDVVGTDKTNKHGKWKIAFQGEGTAHYFASVQKQVQGAAGTTYVCAHATSKPVQAP